VCSGDFDELLPSLFRGDEACYEFQFLFVGEHEIEIKGSGSSEDERLNPTIGATMKQGLLRGNDKGNEGRTNPRLVAP